MGEILIGDKKTVKWPEEDLNKFRQFVDDNVSFTACANLFENVPTHFNRRLATIYKSGKSSPRYYDLIMKKIGSEA